MRGLLAAFSFGLALAMVLAPLGALAQQETDPPSAIYPKVTVYNVTDGDVIEAPIDRPDVGLYSDRSGATRGSLIKVREQMTEKVLASAKEL
ncbi:MAG: hypothetical protein GYA21_13020 [Myxococcales bacterium]|nr:hypothetical protein [Myxococcales bacterium]